MPDEEGALALKLSINPELLDKTLVFADDFPSYQSVFAKGPLNQEGKKQTTMTKRFNNTIRQRCSRLVRKALSFSNKWENHYLAIKYFIVNYNLEKIAKNPSLKQMKKELMRPCLILLFLMVRKFICKIAQKNHHIS